MNQIKIHKVEEVDNDDIQIDGRFGCLASIHFPFVFFLFDKKTNEDEKEKTDKTEETDQNEKMDENDQRKLTNRQMRMR